MRGVLNLNDGRVFKGEFKNGKYIEFQNPQTIKYFRHKISKK